jgi:hypothetical protein
MVMDNGVAIGRRSNRYYYASAIAFTVASGRKLAGRSTKARTRTIESFEPTAPRAAFFRLDIAIPRRTASSKTAVTS